MRDLEKWNPDVRPRLEKALMQYLIPQVWKNTKICMAEYKNDAV